MVLKNDITKLYMPLVFYMTFAWLIKNFSLTTGLMWPTGRGVQTTVQLKFCCFLRNYILKKYLNKQIKWCHKMVELLLFKW